MRPVLFVVFVIFAVCVSAANVPDKRAKRGIVALTGKVAKKFGPIMTKISRLKAVVNKIGLVISIVQTGWEIFMSMKNKMEELSNNPKAIVDIMIAVKKLEKAVDIFDGETAVNLAITIAKIQKYFKQLLSDIGIGSSDSKQKRDVSEVDEELDPKIEKMFNDIEQLIEQIVQNIEKDPSNSEKALFKTELVKLLDYMNNYIQKIDKENVDGLSDERMTVFLEDIQKDLKQMSNELH